MLFRSMEYYNHVYNDINDCDQKPKLRYIEFIQSHERYLLILEKQKYKKEIIKNAQKSKVLNSSLVSGFVYGIVDPRNPEWIKIGCTSDLNERLRQYQTYSPYGNIEYIYYKQVDDKYKSEKLLHMVFDKFRGNGEWFKITKTDFINVFK